MLIKDKCKNCNDNDNDKKLHDCVLFRFHLYLDSFSFAIGFASDAFYSAFEWVSLMWVENRGKNMSLEWMQRSFSSTFVAR